MIGFYGIFGSLMYGNSREVAEAGNIISYVLIFTVLATAITWFAFRIMWWGCVVVSGGWFVVRCFTDVAVVDVRHVAEVRSDAGTGLRVVVRDGEVLGSVGFGSSVLGYVTGEWMGSWIRRRIYRFCERQGYPLGVEYPDAGEPVVYWSRTHRLRELGVIFLISLVWFTLLVTLGYVFGGSAAAG
ncbi:hypothetical protein RIF23_04355 [Lipingzhangella sp. LS1_29]|uniref:PH (Pleckstrin Homology) domain-containing protein n=1 Tax=Lipingzhangella rawalii TaxID=2055835 RepID=A0ABU2H2L1_9ACTN|nr:hypothetical protein [Lipingzhangella rawalii]MDS1269527.1 hypothetical protein [Lipingzhangella rawalii]